MSAPAGSTRGRTVELHDELMSLTLRLVREHPQLPAGSVMRCVARAVRRVMTAGTPREQISARAEHAARRALAGRTHSPLTSDAPGRSTDGHHAQAS